MYLTYLDSNSWLLELGGQNILIDPWLVGPLVFGNLPWLFKGYRPQDRAIPETIDLVVLSQGLEDHAHPQTLKQLNKNLPVVGSPNAAKVVKEFGYTNIHSLEHGQTYRFNEQVEIQAVPGSPIGPTLVENGYIFKELSSGKTVYYEPHGYHSPTLQEKGPIDVIITPMIDLGLPIVGPIIKGTESALKVAQWVKPQVMLPTAAGGDAKFEGLLISLLRAEGTVEDFQQTLSAQGLSTQALSPTPGERLEVPLH
ncbi:MAG: MBL fold metallo-hydrolase [Roseofilum sp. SBFL]|uniref:MBL fold metallo-hydrolase n=1 Tax=unclassified Roseofilum TaxID=2620099 RepID=UPI001B2B6EEB|nr:MULTISPECIES: MBL fold metallo-hydrolase [unclassified Roseofilum]MBP0015828.1 MBL fold metallo-hydrolase [Roseofilum sp. SID3]MBP0025629.1 MBL fold metallo-hydrolase [Roseofilum sp. SID2]MBP0036999.1 MBL fold metallo-hydrolase [Roseofilum sp. SID1]MBP0042734.1 MBL fold metallo-hydrolase [Roseofilum sp. SBFL]